MVGQDDLALGEPLPILFCQGDHAMAEQHTSRSQTADAERKAREVVGYLGAVAAATVSLIVAGIAKEALTTGLNPLRVDILIEIVFIATIFPPVAGVTALAPFLLSRWIARRVGLKAGWYYAACGAATGLMLAPVVFMISPSDTDMTLWEGAKMVWLNAGLLFMLSGASGGLAYWGISGRHASVPGATV